MHSLREIRRRVRSIGSTAQITRAMQMVAASKMRKAQEAALDGRPFAQLLYRIQREATRWSGDLQHPLLEVREVKKRAVFALSQLPKDQGIPLLIGVARSHRNIEVRRQAMFWLGQSKDPRAVTFFEEVLRGK